MDNVKTVYVKVLEGSRGILQFYDKDNKIHETEAFIGINGVTKEKVEGDGKTPIGTFDLGITFGTHKFLNSINRKYIQINNNLYWVDDIKSKYYNQLVDITKVNKDWNSAEHLIEYSREYEYAVEIKVNPENVPGKGSAIFMHCSVGKPTAGCVAIDREKLLELLKCVQENGLICIEKFEK